jgi:hypothetical protein
VKGKLRDEGAVAPCSSCPLGALFGATPGLRKPSMLEIYNSQGSGHLASHLGTIEPHLII